MVMIRIMVLGIGLSSKIVAVRQMEIDSVIQRVQDDGPWHSQGQKGKNRDEGKYFARHQG